MISKLDFNIDKDHADLWVPVVSTDNLHIGYVNYVIQRQSQPRVANMIQFSLVTSPVYIELITYADTPVSRRKSKEKDQNVF